MSENVSPLHLINIKKVAYGLKDCTTLLADDVTFRHPQQAVSQSVKVCGPCRGASVSPAELVASFEQRRNAGAADSVKACSQPVSGSCDEEKLAALVRELIANMKNQNA